MKQYRDNMDRQVVYVDDLSFLCDRNHPYNWLQRHFYHHRLRLWLRNADVIIAADSNVATALVRYYFIPKERIEIASTQQ